MSRCRRCLITGRVQGVFYRASAQRRAEALGLTGHARNLPDGRVEVFACGGSDALDAIEAWLWQGPVAADVTDVSCEPVEAESPERFITR